jgi:hypothetical protein
MERILPNFSYTDESFIKENSYHYSLAIEISYDWIVYLVFDEVKNNYIVIESFNFNKVFNESQLVSSFQNIIDNHDNLKLNYEKTNIVFKSSKYTFIPSPLFVVGEEERYLTFNQEILNSETTLKDFVKNADLFNIYAIPKLLQNFLEDNFKNHKLSHHLTSLVEIIVNKYKNLDENKTVFINLGQSFLDVLVLENQKLLLCNTFQFKTGEEFIYYLMFVFEQMKLNPEKNNLTIIGEIEKDSALYGYIEKYIRNISFIERNNAFKYSYLFDKIPQHYFYNLFNLKLCGL